MPRNSSESSIRTLWENNPDTPLTAANLSRLQDLTASYLNSDDPVLFPGIHVEGSILYANPENSSQLVLKRGTIIQIINEATDMSGDAIIPINQQYRVFDVGLEDIYLTYSLTDETEQSGTTWGGGLNDWFVYLCDTDDSTIYSKTVPSDYGGGAQILISKRNTYPLGDVPGRVGTGIAERYTEKDVRLIGGFKTNGDVIITDSVWDIAGKSQIAKAKAFYILDEYNVNGTVYRQIELQDVNTTVPNTFNSSLTINGNLDVSDITGRDIAVQNITSVGTINQTGNVNIVGDTSIDGDTDITNDFDVQGVSTLNIVNVDGIFNIDDNFVVNPLLSTIESNFPFTQEEVFNLNADFSHIGNIIQQGNVSLGNPISGDSNINLFGNLTHDGTAIYSGSFTVNNGDELNPYEYFIVNPDTQTIALNALSGTTITGPLTLDGELAMNAGNQPIIFNTTGSISSSVGTGIPRGVWEHLGDFTVNNGVFTVQQNDGNPSIVITPVGGATQPNTIDITGIVTTTIPQNEIFLIQDHNNLPILGAEQNSPTERRVTINDVLEISNTGTADNALYVNGNSDFQGDVTISGILDANISGGATTSGQWSNPLTLNFVGTHIASVGAVEFDGSEGSIDVTLEVYDNSHNHTNYLEASNFDSTINGGDVVVHWDRLSNLPSTWTPAEHDNGAHSETYLTWADITFLNFNNLTLMGPGSDQFAIGDHTHSGVYLEEVDATDVSFGASDVDTELNRLDGELANYIPIDGGSVSVDTVPTFTGGILTTGIGENMNRTNYIFSNMLATKAGTYDPLAMVGILFGDAITTTNSTVLEIGTNHIPYIRDLSTNPSTQYRIVTSDGTGNVAPYAARFSSPVSLNFLSSSNGVSGATITGSGGGSGAIGNGDDSTLDIALNLDIGTSSTQIAAGDHDHTSISGSAAKLTYLRNISLSGDVTGNVNFNGANDVVIATTIDGTKHTHNTQYQAKEDGFVYGRVFAAMPSSPNNGDIYIDHFSAAASMYIGDSWKQITN